VRCITSCSTERSAPSVELSSLSESSIFTVAVSVLHTCQTTTHSTRAGFAKARRLWHGQRLGPLGNNGSGLDVACEHKPQLASVRRERSTHRPHRPCLSHRSQTPPAETAHASNIQGCNWQETNNAQIALVWIQDAGVARHGWSARSARPRSPRCAPGHGTGCGPSADPPSSCGTATRLARGTGARSSSRHAPSHVDQTLHSHARHLAGVVHIVGVQASTSPTLQRACQDPCPRRAQPPTHLGPHKRLQSQGAAKSGRAGRTHALELFGWDGFRLKLRWQTHVRTSALVREARKTIITNQWSHSAENRQTFPRWSYRRGQAS
jgi:hypothetical protein